MWSDKLLIIRPRNCITLFREKSENSIFTSSTRFIKKNYTPLMTTLGKELLIIGWNGAFFSKLAPLLEIYRTYEEGLQLFATLTNIGSPLTALTCSLDGRILAGNAEGKLNVWMLRPDIDLTIPDGLRSSFKLHLS